MERKTLRVSPPLGAGMCLLWVGSCPLGCELFAEAHIHAPALALLYGLDGFEVVRASHRGALTVWDIEVEPAGAVAERTVFDTGLLKVFAFSFLKGGNRSGRVAHNAAKRLGLVVGLLGFLAGKVHNVAGLVNAVMSNQGDGLVEGLRAGIARLGVVEAFEEVGNEFFGMGSHQLVMDCSRLRF